jgi:hypothetical protein
MLPAELPTGKGNSVMTPAVVIRPMSPPQGQPKPEAVNHSAPSGPVVMLPGTLFPVRGNSVTSPDIVIRPINPPQQGEVEAVNHIAPSGPAVIPSGTLFELLGMEYWVIEPEVVIRPMNPPQQFEVAPVNHSAPSGPGAITWGRPPPDIGYSVTDIWSCPYSDPAEISSHCNQTRRFMQQMTAIAPPSSNH